MGGGGVEGQVGGVGHVVVSGPDATERNKISTQLQPVVDLGVSFGCVSTSIYAAK